MAMELGTRRLKILFVTGMIGGEKSCGPVADTLAAFGHDVRIAAEGKAVGAWAGRPNPSGGTWPILFVGNPDGITTDFEPGKIFHDFHPDVVVCGTSNPMHMEALVTAEARKHSIPVAFIEDIWAGSMRNPEKPDLVFTLDASSEQILRSDVKNRYAETQIVLAGQPALAALKVTPEEDAAIDKIRSKYERIVLFSGQGPLCNRDMLNVALTSLLKVSGPFAFIPAFHPKYLKQGRNEAIWEAQLEMFDARQTGHVVRMPKGVSTDAMAARADITISGDGTPLIHAAWHGKMAISISTPSTRAEIADRCPYAEWPGLAMGIGAKLDEPVEDLFAFAEQHADRVHTLQQRFRELPMLTPDMMAERILRL